MKKFNVGSCKVRLYFDDLLPLDIEIFGKLLLGEYFFFKGNQIVEKKAEEVAEDFIENLLDNKCVVKIENKYSTCRVVGADILEPKPFFVISDLYIKNTKKWKYECPDEYKIIKTKEMIEHKRLINRFF